MIEYLDLLLPKNTFASKVNHSVLLNLDIYVQIANQLKLGIMMELEGSKDLVFRYGTGVFVFLMKSCV